MPARRFEDSSRGKQVAIDFEGNPVAAYDTEPIAVALLAAGHGILSRSVKYHRPRGAFCLSGHCGSCLVRVDGIPNVKACLEPCREGTKIERQNAWPSASHDLLAAADFVFSEGLNPHEFMTQPELVNRAMQMIVHKLSGLGGLPSEGAPELPARRQKIHSLVVGGGPAGLAAAREAAAAGDTLLIDDQLELGGRLLADPRYGRQSADRMIRHARRAGAILMSQTAAIGAYVEEGLIAAVSAEGLLLLETEQVVIATGTYPQKALFEGNDLPGVLPSRAARKLIVAYGVCAGERAIVVGEGFDADSTAAALESVGCSVERASAILEAAGSGRVESARTPEGQTLVCDLVVVCEPPSAASELARQLGVEVRLGKTGGFEVSASPAGRTSASGVFACGDVCGARTIDAVIAQGMASGRAAAGTPDS